MKRNRQTAALMLCAMLASVISPRVGAGSYGISPALDVIAQDICLEKCTARGEELVFSKADFENTVGKPVEYITVTKLPDPSVGVLKYAGSDVFADQSVNAKNISLLKFVPGSGTGSTEFEFCVNGEKSDSSVPCSISILENRNRAPVAEKLSLQALSGISLTASAPLYDPDGDSCSITVTNFPEKGVLKLCGNSFMYTCAEGESGKDSFSYKVKDCYGNSTENITVSIGIREPKTDIRYDDMHGHWGHTAVMRMTELGLMSGMADGTRYVFCPDEPVSRGDFLAMAMISAGLEEKVKPGAVTTFADDSEIPENIRSYASFALSVGYISGYETENGSVFRSDGTITRAQAASVLSNILGERASIYEFDFADAASVPTWAKDSFASLVSLGIISGTPDGILDPHGELTRAEAAQLLCNTAEYIENKDESSREKGVLEKLMELFGK